MAPYEQASCFNSELASYLLSAPVHTHIHTSVGTLLERLPNTLSPQSVSWSIRPLVPLVKGSGMAILSKGTLRF